LGDRLVGLVLRVLDLRRLGLGERGETADERDKREALEHKASIKNVRSGAKWSAKIR